MGTGEFRAYLERALFLDREDPVAAWRELSRFQERLIARLSSGRELRLQAPGTDLTLSVAGRTWVNSDGRRNMPSGEVFTGPLEDSAEGEVRFNLPAFVGGRRVEGIHLRFSRGEVVEARAEVGEGYLREALSTDPGARRLGEVGLGTNFALDRPTGLVLLDEKMGARFTWPWAGATRKRGERTRAPSTGTWSSP